MRDVRLIAAEQLAERAAHEGLQALCEVCERPLPRGCRGTHCLHHPRHILELVHEIALEDALEELHDDALNDELDDAVVVLPRRSKPRRAA